MFTLYFIQRESSVAGVVAVGKAWSSFACDTIDNAVEDNERAIVCTTLVDECVPFENEPHLDYCRSNLSAYIFVSEEKNPPSGKVFNRRDSVMLTANRFLSSYPRRLRLSKQRSEMHWPSILIIMPTYWSSFRATLNPRYIRSNRQYRRSCNSPVRFWRWYCNQARRVIDRCRRLACDNLNRNRFFTQSLWQKCPSSCSEGHDGGALVVFVVSANSINMRWQMIRWTLIWLREYRKSEKDASFTSARKIDVDQRRWTKASLIFQTTCDVTRNLDR